MTDAALDASHGRRRHWPSRWSPGDWAAVITATLMVIGILLGAAWWASAMFSEVQGIGRTLTEFRSEVKETLDEHAKRLNHLEARGGGP